jgi:hypothetical protein
LIVIERGRKARGCGNLSQKIFEGYESQLS